MGGLLDGLPLSPKQVKSIVECRSHRISAWTGAVRSGKTVASLVAFVMALAEAPPSGLIICAGKTLQTVERNLIEPLQNPELFGLVSKHVQHTRGASTANILGRTVHLIGAADARAESKLRGLTAYLIMLDEATLLPSEFMVQALARLSAPNARLMLTTNPAGPRHWLRRDYLLRDELDLGHWQFSLDDNPFLEPAYVRSLKAEMTGVFYARNIEGKWIAAEGSVYSMWDEDVHIVDEIPPIVEWIGTGVDHGTANPLHAVLVGLGIDGCLYAVSEWRYSGRETQHQLTDLEYSERLRGWLKAPAPGLSNVFPPYMVIDPSAANFITQAHRDGMSPWPADNSVLDGIRLMSSLLAAGKLKVHRRCKVLIEEIGGYVWDERAALLGEDKPLKVDDHGCDAIRYCLKTTEGTWRHRVLPSAA